MFPSVFFNIYFFVYVRFFTIHATLTKHNVVCSQTIYGELISLESNSDALGLAMFILQRLLWNPDIAAQFRHAKVPNLYKDGNLRASVIVSSECLKTALLLPELQTFQKYPEVETFILGTTCCDIFVSKFKGILSELLAQVVFPLSYPSRNVNQFFHIICRQKLNLGRR